MKSVSILLALVLGVGLALRPGSLTAAPASGGKSATGGGSAAGPGTGAKSMPSAPGKSGALSGPVGKGGGTLGVGQPCDVRAVRGFGGRGRFGFTTFSGPTYLIVEASPLDAQVFLDGSLLGAGRDLVARSFPLAPGRHAVEIVAPGLRPYIVQFGVAQGSFPVRFRVALPKGRTISDERHSAWRLPILGNRPPEFICCPPAALRPCHAP